ncbi:hypothetical protein DHEL01_v203465 [Diaporthe helianthi]|uniref:Uncharacterized protein n=1 Tax=Diaporthe helianthi TaxID=158607 RepID=A0A2P5I6N0_DIAHE|nr:hypothetical protein DHEL01_v203465 [Diaporthe helianthi]
MAYRVNCTAGQQVRKSAGPQVRRYLGGASGSTHPNLNPSRLSHSTRSFRDAPPPTIELGEEEEEEHSRPPGPTD